jgi:DNA-binding IclR family transcriptional regulator
VYPYENIVSMELGTVNEQQDVHIEVSAPPGPVVTYVGGVEKDQEPGVTPSGVKSSLRTLEILELLGSTGERNTVAGIARELGIPKSSLHGLLRTMASRGWLETDSSGTLYGLGLRALLTGTAYVESDDIVLLTQTALDDLAAVTGETVHLGRLDGPNIVYLAKRESQHTLRLYSAVGRRLPAHATALGKTLLAQLSPEEVDERLTWPLEPLTEHTITDRAQLHKELEAIRDRGYSTDLGENSLGIQCTAVSLSPVGSSLNALSCSVPDSRVTDDVQARVRKALIQAKAQTDSLTRHLRRA